jgi:hypothetical protein
MELRRSKLAVLERGYSFCRKSKPRRSKQCAFDTVHSQAFTFVLGVVAEPALQAGGTSTVA